jgi:hypothetical protein
LPKKSANYCNFFPFRLSTGLEGNFLGKAAQAKQDSGNGDNIKTTESRRR